MYSIPLVPVPVRMSWLSGQLVVQPGAPSVWLGIPYSLGRSFLIVASASPGRSMSNCDRLDATRRPSASYHGPVPTRSRAWTGPLLAPPVVVLRKARHAFEPVPGQARSAAAAQILSAPR